MHTSRRPLKVVHVVTRLNVGGVSVLVVNLTAGLDDEHITSSLVAGVVGTGEESMAYFADEQDVDFSVISSMRRAQSLTTPVLGAAAVAKLCALFRRTRPDIVHTHTTIAGALGRVAATLARVPIRVHSFYGHVLDGYYPKPAAEALIWIERRLAQLTDRLVVLGESQARDLALVHRIAPREKFRVIPPGFDLSPFGRSGDSRGRLRNELGIDPSCHVIGVAGRMVEVKNLSMFLRAGAEVIRQRPNTALVLVGDGPERPHLERLAKTLAIIGQVHFIGWRRQMADVFADLDVLALTSKNEGVPNVLIEAMASGVPVVATEVGGIPDFIENGETGLLVPSGDAHAFARALVSLVDDRDMRRRIAEAGRERAETRFAASRMVADMRELYTGLAEGLVH